MYSQQSQYPTPSAYFIHSHGKIQYQPVTFEINNNILPNEQFTVPSNSCQDPRFIMSSVNAFPRTPAIQKQAGVPLTLHITPFPQDVQVQLIPEAPRRCKRCGAYPSYIDKIVGSDSICGICGRRNQLTEIEIPQQQQHSIAVDYLAYDLKYTVATVNADGRIGELQSPANISHVAANVLTTVDIQRQCSAAVDYRKPSVERLSKLQAVQIKEELELIKILDEHKNQNIHIEQPQQEDEYVQQCKDRLENIQKIKFQQIQIIIIPITQYTVFQSLYGQVLGVLSQFTDNQLQYEELCKQQPSMKQVKVTKFLTIPIFTVGEHVYVFSNRGNFEVHQLYNDLAGGECMLPLPAEYLCVPEDVKQRGLWEQQIMQFLQEDYTEWMQHNYSAASDGGLQQSTGQGQADALTCAISSLQCSGGQITILLTSALQNKVLATPMPPGLSDEAGNNQNAQMYKETHYENVESGREAALYIIPNGYQRLADEAAGHGISVNIIAVPLPGRHLGLPQAFALCQKTGGRLYSCPAVQYATDLEQTGLQYFVLCSLHEILNAPGRLCTATVRSSSGLQVDFEKCQPAAWNIGGSGLLAVLGVHKQTHMNSNGLVGGGVISSDLEWHSAQLTHNQSFSCDVFVDTELQNNSCAIQLAVLYTGRFGRMVRVVTVQYSVATTAGDIYNAGNQFALAAALARRAAYDFLSRPTSSTSLQPVCLKPYQAANVVMAVTGAAGAVLDNQEILNDNSMQHKQLQALNAGISLISAPNIPDGVPRLSFIFSYRTHIRDWLVRILSTFRKLTGRQKDPRFLVSYVQQLMPLYAHSLIRAIFLQQQRQQNEGGIITADTRIADAVFMLYATPLSICRQLVPGIYRVRKNWWVVNEQDGEQLIEDPSDVQEINSGDPMGPGNPGAGTLPAPIQPDSMHVRESYKRIYIYCTPNVFVIKVGKQTPEWLIKSIKSDGIQSQQVIYDFEDTGLQVLLQNLRSLYNYKGGVYVSFGEDFYALLTQQMYIMDPTSKYQSYRDFLSGIYTTIQAQ